MQLLIFTIFSLVFVDFINSSADRIVIYKKNPLVKVMIIDSAVNTELNRFNKRIKPFFLPKLGENNMGGHGDKVASALLFGDLRNKKELCPQVEIISCRIIIDGNFSNSSYLRCLEAAETMGISYINISTQYGVFEKEEYDALKKLTEKGTKVVVAAGNRSLDYNKKASYPAAYDADGNDNLFKALNSNFIAVQALDENGDIARYSNTGENAASEYGNFYMYDSNGDVGYFGGTSFASPLFLHNMIMDEVCGE